MLSPDLAALYQVGAARDGPHPMHSLARKLDALEQKYDARFRVVFDAIRELTAPAGVRRRPIGFRA